MIKDVAFFAYAVSDIKKARTFYEGILGLKPNGEYDKDPESQWIEYNVGSTTIGIGCSPDFWKPSPIGASAAFEVENFDEAVEAMKKHGVTIVMGPNEFPSCKMLVIADPDGNKITLHKRNSK